MDEIFNSFKDNKQIVKIVGGLAISSVIIYTWKKLSKSKHALHKSDFKRDVVYLYQLPPIETVPSLSPYCLKLESFLRMNEIPYEDIRGNTFSSVGMVPFVEFNGQELTDSNMIIYKLSEHFYKHETQLSPFEQGVSRSVSMMLDQQTLFSYVYYRYCMAMDSLMEAWTGINFFTRFVIKWRLPINFRKRCYYQSIGRLPDSEILQVGFVDLKALSQILGDKAFIHGDSPTLVDCCVFSHLAQLLYIPQVDYPHTKYIRLNCPNLVEYAERFKSRVWPDWDKVCFKTARKSS